MMLTISEGHAATEARHLSTLLEHQVDGLIILPVVTEGGHRYANAKLLRQYTARGIPTMVVVDRPDSTEIACGSVVNDLYRGGRLLLDHLLALGHQHIAMFHLADDPKLRMSRYQAYKDALNAAGVSREQRYARQIGLTPEEANRATAALLDDVPDVTAIIYPSDFLALGGLRRIRERQLRVPKDISLAAFEDLQWAAFCEIPLTTVSYPIRSMGELAITRLADWLSSPVEQRRPLQSLVLEPTLMARDSTGPAPRR
jgi:DNA-binding LacI/PurR family transcriptional regulator